MSRAVEDRIAAVAARQHGVVTRGQLEETGLKRSAIDRRVACGRLRVLYRGVYLAAPFPLARSRELAAVLASAPDALLSHLSATGLFGWRPAPPGDVDVAVAGNRGRRRGIRAHRVEPLPDDERSVRDGIPVTSAARTLLDIATLLDAGDLEAAVARAERERLTTREALSALLARHPRHPGTPALRGVLAQPGGPALTRSAAEAAFLALVREAGLPAPECNVGIGRYEVDFLWRAGGIAVEVDGFRYHSSRERFEGDRRKDAQLLAAGITVLRFSWRQITAERVATAVQLALALARAGVAYAPRSSFLRQ